MMLPLLIWFCVSYIVFVGFLAALVGLNGRGRLLNQSTPTKYFLILTLILTIPSCGLTSTQVQAGADQLTSLNQQALAVKAQLTKTQEQLQATTRPTVVTPEPTATNPAPEPIVVQPTPATIATEKKAEAAVTTSITALDKAIQGLTAATAVLHSAATGQDPGPAVTAAAPLAGPYAGFVSLVGILVSLGWGIFSNIKARSASAAASSAVDGVQAAIAAGQLVVTSAGAAGTVDSMVTDHAITNRLVDVIAAAPVTKG